MSATHRRNWNAREATPHSRVTAASPEHRHADRVEAGVGGVLHIVVGGAFIIYAIVAVAPVGARSIRTGAGRLRRRGNKIEGALGWVK
jgi:hypothetical protein